MFHYQKKPQSMDNNICASNNQGDHSGLVLTTDPKPRLRWSVELHERFVDAVAQLGGPDKATPKTIMRVMGVKGLTLYHLKSHLQKFRLGKQPHREFYDQYSMKDVERASSLVELQRNNTSSGPVARNMNEMQMEVNRRLHEQLEVQRHLQLRIEAQGKYMQTILEKACQTLSDGETTAACEISAVKKFLAPPENSTGLQDLNIYGCADREEFGNNNNQYSSSKFNNKSSGKRPMIWADDLRLKDQLGQLSAVDDDDDHHHHQIQFITSRPIDRGSDVDLEIR